MNLPWIITIIVLSTALILRYVNLYKKDKQRKMRAKIIERNEKRIIIEWSGKPGFGQLILKYDNKGGYKIDAEYIGFKTLFDIIKAVKFKKLNTKIK